MNPEYRTCPLTGRIVILAPERAARPVALQHFAPHHRDALGGSFCPFCVGNEWDTPETKFEVRDGAGWQLRVVANKFPAVNETLRAATVTERDGANRSLTDAARHAFGHHEVVIECREHVSDPTQLTPQQLANVFIACRERTTALMSLSEIRSVAVFRNVGAEAGASLPHAHSQILATPFVPEALKRELDGARLLPSVFESMVNDESRRVARSDRFAVVCPFAPRFAYEMWLLPVTPQPRFEAVTDAECRELAGLLQRVLGALDRVQSRPAYNWVLHSAPTDDTTFRWHLEVLPRLNRAAGFEWSTGVFINAVPPEVAAAQLCGEYH